MKTWADLTTDLEQQIRAWFTSSPAGPRLITFIDNAAQSPDDLSERDRDYLLWLMVLDELCRRTAGVSFTDLADYA